MTEVLSFSHDSYGAAVYNETHCETCSKGRPKRRFWKKKRKKEGILGWCKDFMRFFLKKNQYCILDSAGRGWILSFLATPTTSHHIPILHSTHTPLPSQHTPPQADQETAVK